MLGLGHLRIEPLGHGRVAKGLRVIAQVMRHHGQYMAALVQPDAERAGPQQALDDLEDIIGGRHLVGIKVNPLGQEEFCQPRLQQDVRNWP